MKMSYNEVKKGVVPVQEKKGKEKPIISNRGVKHYQASALRNHIEFNYHHFLVQIIAAVAGVKESYNNIRVIFKILKLEQYPTCKIVADLKASAIILGIQTARSK